jgi:hypothetical protein
MPASGDRSIRSGHGPLVAMIVIIAAIAAGGALIWSRFGAGPAPDLVEDASGPASAVLARPDEPLQLTIFVPVNGMLERVSTGVTRQPELQLEAREAAAAVLASERAGDAAVLKDLELQGFYLDATGTAYIDLVPTGRKDLRGSAWEELLAVYALVNTLTQNFPEVRQVRFLLDGRESPTLAGHIDLTRAFVKRIDLLRQEGAE